MDEKDILKKIKELMDEPSPPLAPESTLFEFGRLCRLACFLALLAKERGLIKDEH